VSTLHIQNKLEWVFLNPRSCKERNTLGHGRLCILKCQTLSCFSQKSWKNNLFHLQNEKGEPLCIKKIRQWFLFSDCYRHNRSQVEKSNESFLFEQKCQNLLKEPEIRFAGLINPMGHLVAGGMKKGLKALEDDADMRKLYMELILRVSTRQEFDKTLGEVKYSASRRSKTVVMSFPIDNKVLLVSANPDVSIDDTAKKVMKIAGI